MNSVLKYALLAIFLINNGWAQSNQLEANEASLAEQENTLAARAESCPSTGIQCVPDCSNQFRQCVGGRVYDVLNTAPGTLCKAGVIVHSYECPTTSGSSTQATPAATERPPTQRPPTQATSKPVTPATAAPTQKPPTSAPATQKPTSAPATQKPPTSAPATPKPSVPSVGLCDITPVAQEPLKFLVPLYVYPGAAWDNVAAGGLKVPTVAIVNPNSGPTAKPDSSYTSYMNKLKTNKVEMVGYVYTSWGARSITDVKRDIDTYVTNWPGIEGIFFDEGSAEAKDIPFYRELYNYVIGKGYKQVILNPGVQPDAGYAAISTNIVIFEDYGNKFTSTKTYPSWVTCAPNASQKAGYKYKFSGIAHTVSGNTASTDVIKNMEKSGIGMVYVTDGAGGCCTYNNLVSYYSSQASSIQAINQS
jgi:hypothetical protein